jgi:hypothetical protein
MLVGHQAIRQFLGFFEALSVQPNHRRAHTGFLLTGQLDFPNAVYPTNFDNDCLTVVLP